MLGGLEKRIPDSLPLALYCTVMNRGKALIGRPHGLPLFRDDGLRRVTILFKNTDLG